MSQLGFDINERLDFLEKLIREQQSVSKSVKKQYRKIPDCEILLPKMELDGHKLLLRFIFKTAAVQTFKGVRYKKFRCILNFSNTFTQFQDGSTGPGFSIFSGEVVFLSNINKLMRMFQHDDQDFWNLYDKYHDDEYFNSIKYRMSLLPVEGLDNLRYGV